jgi:tetratricopeptide (TPR) repeat protein
MPTDTLARALTMIAAALVLVGALLGDRAAAQPAQKSELEEQAAELYKRGRAYYDTGDYEKALAQFTAAQALAPRPLLNYHLARTHQGLGNKVKALQLFQTFVAEEPDNKAADDARTQIASLAAEIAASKPGTDPVGPGPGPVTSGDPKTAISTGEPVTDPVLDPAAGNGADPAAGALERPADPPRETPRTSSRRNRMLWLAAGVAALAAGVALDTLPGSADNGEVDGLDFAPVGLYGLGVTGLVLGVF